MSCSSRLAAGMFCVIVSLATLGSPQQALGQTANFWEDLGGTEDWFDGGNWSLDAPPDDTESALFREGGYSLTINIGANEARMHSFRVRHIPRFNGDTGSESEIEIVGVNPNDSMFIALQGIELDGEPDLQFLEFKNLSVFAGDNTGVRLFNNEASSRARLDFFNSGVFGDRGFTVSGAGSGELNIWNSVFRGDPAFVSEISATGRLQASRSTIGTPIDNEGHWDVYDDTTFEGKQLTGAGTVALNTPFQFLSFDPSGSGTVEVTNSISGPGGVKIESGAVEFVTPNSFTGGLQLHGGTLRARRASRLGGTSNYLQFSGGTLQATDNFTISIPIFVTGGVLDTNGNDIGITGDLDGGTDSIFTKLGAGTLTLDNDGSGYTGSYVVAEGTLVSGAGDTFSNRSQVTVDDGATLRFEQAENFDAIKGEGVVNVNGQTVKLGYSDTIENDFAGELIGPGVVEKLGNGSQRFSGDASGFTGTFTLTSGILAFAAGESLDHDLTVPSAATLIFDPQEGTTTFAHSISGGGLWLKEGAGTLNLTGSSLGFSGLMSVGAGRVNINGPFNAADMVVTAAGTLGGSGSISASVFAEEGSTISPGSSIGKLTVAMLEMLEDAELEIELSGSGGVAGDDFDQLAVIGDATINDAVLSVSLADGFMPLHGDEFLVLDVGGATTGSGFTVFDLEEVPGMAWDTSNLMATGTISLSVTLPGDYNFDGTVNAADYTVWRNHLGMPANSLPSNIDAGPIGAAQYATWRNHYGLSAAAAGTGAVEVPEPGAWWLLFVAGAVLFPSSRSSSPVVTASSRQCSR